MRPVFEICFVPRRALLSHLFSLVLSGKLAAYDLTCSHGTSSLFQMLTTKIFIVFENTLGLNLLTLFSMKELQSSLFLLTASVSWAKFLSHFSIAEAEIVACFF